jgi:hypothetical protein
VLRLPTPKRVLERLEGLARQPSARLAKRRFASLHARGGDLIDTAGEAVVSLTSHGARLRSVHLAIESIGAGHAKPARLILWLEGKDLGGITPALNSQLARGLEIRETCPVGPHGKYFGYIMSRDRCELPLVTADDDILYPKGWLRGLLSPAAGKRVIRCHRARKILTNSAGLRPYNDWPLVRTTAPSVRHLATGVSGALYPPAFLDSLREAGDGFMATVPKADDLWLHATALRSGYGIAQVSARPRHFPIIPGTGEVGLMLDNVLGSANDIQAARLYTSSDLDVLRSARDKS